MRFPNVVAAMGLVVWLVGCGGGGASGGGQAAPVAVPTASLAAAPSSVASGATVALTWSSTGATACAATGGWTGAVATSGTQSSSALTADTVFSLTCSGAGGTSTAVTAAVTVVPPPTVTLTVDQSSVTVGAAATLTWASANATACTASGAWSGELAANGTQSTGALAASSTFTIVCTGPGGSSPSATATVNVVAPPVNPVPTATLTASPTVVTSGGVSTLAWTSKNATACTGSGGTLAGTLGAAGSVSSGALTATTVYTLVCNGPGGAGAAATATVTVSATTMTVTPATAALTLTRSQQFTAAVPGGGLATWAVDGVVGGNAAVGTVSGTGLYTAGTTAGIHTVVATSAANAADIASAVAGVTDLAGVYTYHNNNSRDGTNVQEYLLTKNTVTAARFGKVASCLVDGAVVAQPLWASNVIFNAVKHNVVYAATEHDGLHAFEADSSPCAKLWSVNLIDAAHGGTAGETTVPWTLVGANAGDIQPEIGVTGTPVIDPVAGILYVVSKSVNAAQTTFYQRLHAIDIVTGAEKAGSPLLITGTYPGTGDGTTVVTFNSKQELQRTGLALINGIVYVAFTAHEDKNPWYGWMMSYQYNGTALVQKSTINVAPNTQRAGIWMSGGAPASDVGNKLYVITGNGKFNASTKDYGDSLLQLAPDLTVSQWFTPQDQVNDDAQDVDFGSGGATVLADLPAGNTVVHALICGGKDSTLYVLNRDLLGGFGTAGIVQQLSFNAKIFATGAFWNNGFYLGGVGGPLQNYKLNTTNAQMTLASSSIHKYGFAGATPSVSSNAAQNGIVWSLETGSYCTKRGNTVAACGPAVLFAHDAANVATELWNSSTNAADAAGYAVKFTLPTVANGRVYVGTRGNNIGGAAGSTSSSGQIDIYGLKP